jgi:O-antigen ligase
LLALAMAWAAFTATLGHGTIAPVFAMLVPAAAALVAARLVGRLSPYAVPALIVAVAVVIIAPSPRDVLNALPRGGPFGFSSITGAFYLQCAIAGFMVAMAPWWPARIVGVASGVGLGLVPFVTQTQASVFVLPLIAAAAAVGIGRQDRIRPIVATCLIVVAVGVGSAAILGVLNPHGTSGAFNRAIDATVTARRISFWHDAVTLLARHPLTGIGPGRFADESATVRRDPDEPWAHNEFLQAGAEQGVIGMALLILLFGWGFIRLLHAQSPRGIVVLGAVALAALGIHACIEYVLQRPVVPVVAAALLGTAIGPFGWRARHVASDIGS